jgi:hypothetical protein
LTKFGGSKETKEIVTKSTAEMEQMAKHMANNLDVKIKKTLHSDGPDAKPRLHERKVVLRKVVDPTSLSEVKSKPKFQKVKVKKGSLKKLAKSRLHFLSKMAE